MIAPMKETKFMYHDVFEGTFDTIINLTQK